MNKSHCQRSQNTFKLRIVERLKSTMKCDEIHSHSSKKAPVSTGHSSVSKSERVIARNTHFAVKIKRFLKTKPILHLKLHGFKRRARLKFNLSFRE